MASQVQGKPVLYLDFDGVLHHENVRRHRRRGIFIDAPGQHRLFEHAGWLEQALDPYPGIWIVLSTSWVRVLGYRRAASRLPTTLQQRLIGATYHSQMQAEHFEQLARCQQIFADVQRRQPVSWLALDDDAEHWPASARHRLVLTDGERGLGDPAARADLKARLAVLASFVRIDS